MKTYYVFLQPGMVVKKYMDSLEKEEFLNSAVQAGLTAFEVNEAELIFVGTDKWVWSLLSSNPLSQLEGVKTNES